MNNYISSEHRIAQLEGLLTAADAEIQAQIRSRLELENKVRNLTNELRTALTTLSERTRIVEQLKESETKAATELSSLAQRLTAVRNRKEELEKQVNTLNQTIANLSKKLITTDETSSSSRNSNNNNDSSSSTSVSMVNRSTKRREKSLPSRQVVPLPPTNIVIPINNGNSSGTPSDYHQQQQQQPQQSSSVPPSTSSDPVVELHFTIQEKKEIHQQYLLLQGLRNQVILLRNMFIDARKKYQMNTVNYEEQIQAIERENQQLVRKNSDLLLQLSSSFEKRMNNDYNLESIKGEILTLRTRLISADTQIHSLVNQLQDEKDKFMDSETKYSNLRNQYNQLFQHFTEKENFITSLQNDYDNLRLQTQEKDLKHGETMNTILIEINRLTKQQTMVENIVRTLQTEKMQAIHEINRLTKELNKIPSVISPSLTNSVPSSTNPVLPLFDFHTSTTTVSSHHVTKEEGEVDNNTNTYTIDKDYVSSSPALSTNVSATLSPHATIAEYTKQLNELQLRFQDDLIEDF